MSITEKFTALFDGLEECDEEEQVQKIMEINGLIDEMNGKEFESIFTIELFNKIHQKIEKNSLSLVTATLLLKHVGRCKELKCFLCDSFDDSSLSESMKEMIINESEKKNDEMLLIDLCECFTFLYIDFIPDEFRSIIVHCLLKAASKKEGNEETQKEVEMALLCLSCIDDGTEIEQGLYLNEITEIIKHHQEHHNLTRLANQSAWQFLMNRFYWDKNLEEVIVNELHFAREARRELEDLSKSVDWKKKEEGKGENEAKEVLVIERWFDVISEFLNSYTLWDEELAGLIGSLVQMIRESRDNHKDICNRCLDSLRCAAENRNVEIDVFLKEGTIVVFSEEMNQSTVNDDILWNCLLFFLNISERIKEKTDGETTKTKRKELKRKIFEKMEEEGYEDIITSFHEMKI
eukprot:MONOS_1744.1-p1 / transcript=MONOS_1744.1 / gene=MONOS_1744 / organism=Monocercomonoides_exilis_PA203 / gene_product=unspecified product / transcript_product=unspecified product / location=Mono_scaffold00032:116615-118099(+) / protein_length=406 / sequence_SO=supercontig / SO=protein_coding / is_pseudo=false